jgi:hypothetical protein
VEILAGLFFAFVGAMINQYKVYSNTKYKNILASECNTPEINLMLVIEGKTASIERGIVINMSNNFKKPATNINKK